MPVFQLAYFRSIALYLWGAIDFCTLTAEHGVHVGRAIIRMYTSGSRSLYYCYMYTTCIGSKSLIITITECKLGRLVFVCWLLCIEHTM